MINCTWGGVDSSHGSPGVCLIVMDSSGMWQSTNQIFYQQVRAMEIYHDKLIIGSKIVNSGSADGVIVYDDTFFSIPAFNGTIPPKGPIYSFAEMNDNLYAGGWIEYQDTNGIILTRRVCYFNSSIFYSNSQICEGEVYDFNGHQINTTGIYFDTLISQSGSDSIIALYLTVAVLNPVIILSNDTLTASGNGTVQWYDCNSNQIINGATDNIYIPSIAGSYAAIITNGNCSDTTACKDYTSVNGEWSMVNELKVYPNPVENQLTVGSMQSAVGSIEIRNLLGQVVLSEKYATPKNTVQLNVISLPRGMYLLQVRTKDGEARNVKFVREGVK